MSLAFKRVKTYLRVGLVLIVVAATAIVLWKNRNHRVEIWFFGLTDQSRPINVLWLIMWTVFATQTVEWVFRFSRGMVKDWRELNRASAEARERQEQKKRETELIQREQRIEEMLKRGVVSETSEPSIEPRKKEKKPGEGK